MQSFEAAARLQSGFRRFLHAWENMTADQCASPSLAPRCLPRRPQATALDVNVVTHIFGRCANNYIFGEPDAQLFAVPDRPYEPSAYLYDGVVALALAMDAMAANDTAALAMDAMAANDTAEEAQGQEPVGSKIDIGVKLLKELKERVRFDGASGPIDLDNVTGDREPATLLFALESFGDVLAADPMILAYTVSANNIRLNNDSTIESLEMVATANLSLQWIGGKQGRGAQPKDAITSKVRGCLLCLPPSYLTLHYPLL